MPALVHVSAIGADPEAPSAYGRSKGEGEAAVRAAFPDATIVRPSIAFGLEDDFVNRFARMAQLLPVLPVIRGSWKLQPVHAADLGKAIAQAALDPGSHAGRTYELGGPQVMTMREFEQWICRETGRNRPLVDIPDPISGLLAAPDRLAAGRADHARPMADDGAGQCRAPGPASRPSASARRRSPPSRKAGSPLYRRHGRFATPSPY